MYRASRRPRILGSAAINSQLSTTRNTPTLAQPLTRRRTNHVQGSDDMPWNRIEVAISAAKQL